MRIQRSWLKESVDVRSEEKGALKRITLSQMTSFLAHGRTVQTITPLLEIQARIQTSRILLIPCSMVKVYRQMLKLHLLRLFKKVDALKKFLFNER